MPCSNCRDEVGPSYEGEINPEVYPELFEEEAWGFESEGESLMSEAPRPAPSPAPGPRPGVGRCSAPIILDDFRPEEYTLRFKHYRLLLRIPVGRIPILVLRGHTDNRGDPVSNLGLSLSRVFEVLEWLTQLNGGRPVAKRIIREGLGATQPRGNNATEAGRSQNRRVEILLCQAPPPPPIIANTIRLPEGNRTA
jgi:hypothetical protein